MYEIKTMTSEGIWETLDRQSDLQYAKYIAKEHLFGRNLCTVSIFHRELEIYRIRLIVEYDDTKK